MIAPNKAMLAIPPGLYPVDASLCYNKVYMTKIHQSSNFTGDFNPYFRLV